MNNDRPFSQKNLIEFLGRFSVQKQKKSFVSGWAQIEIGKNFQSSNVETQNVRILNRL